MTLSLLLAAACIASVPGRAPLTASHARSMAFELRSFFRVESPARSTLRGLGDALKGVDLKEPSSSPLVEEIRAAAKVLLAGQERPRRPSELIADAEKIGLIERQFLLLLNEKDRAPFQELARAFPARMPAAERAWVAARLRAVESEFQGLELEAADAVFDSALTDEIPAAWRLSPASPSPKDVFEKTHAALPNPALDRSDLMRLYSDGIAPIRQELGEWKARLTNMAGAIFLRAGYVFDAQRAFKAAIAAEPAVGLYRLNLALAQRAEGSFIGGLPELFRAMALGLPGLPYSTEVKDALLAFVRRSTLQRVDHQGDAALDRLEREGALYAVPASLPQGGVSISPDEVASVAAAHEEIARFMGASEQDAKIQLHLRLIDETAKAVAEGRMTAEQGRASLDAYKFSRP